VFGLHRFKLVEPPVPKTVKFNVGDIVRFKDGSAKGIDYEVSHVCEQEIRLWVSDARKGQTSWFSNAELELVAPKPCEPKVTYTVTWKAPANGYKSLIDGELSFGEMHEAYGFANLFKTRVNVTVTKD
jgi:hypothetical protein